MDAFRADEDWDTTQTEFGFGRRWRGGIYPEREIEKLKEEVKVEEVEETPEEEEKELIEEQKEETEGDAEYSHMNGKIETETVEEIAEKEAIQNENQSHIQFANNFKSNGDFESAAGRIICVKN